MAHPTNEQDTPPRPSARSSLLQDVFLPCRPTALGLLWCLYVVLTRAHDELAALVGDVPRPRGPISRPLHTRLPINEKSIDRMSPHVAVITIG